MSLFIILGLKNWDLHISCIYLYVRPANGGFYKWGHPIIEHPIYIYIKMDNLGVPPLLGNSIFETTPSMFFGARQFHVVPVLL